MLKWIVRNLQSFLLAFFLALFVWILAVLAADPDETRVYPRSIALEITGQDPRLILTGNIPRQVNLTLRAPQSVWVQLLAAENQVRAVIDLAGLAAGEHSVPVQLQVRISPFRVINLSPERVNLTLEPLASRSLPVDVVVNGQPAIGYEMGDIVLTQREVTISGPESLVRQAVRAEVNVIVDGVRAVVNVDAPIRILNENGNVLSGLSLSIDRVAVQVPIIQQGGYRDIAVKVVVRGQVASGYRLTNISVNPPAITVFSGDPTLVNALPGFVETEPLNLNGASQDIELRLGLNLPVGVSVVGEQTVLVEVNIDAIEGSLSLNNMPVTIVGLGEGLEAEPAPDTVDIILTGPLPLLEKLTANDIRISLDVTDLEEGTYQIVPLVEILLTEIEIQSIFPGTVEVVITIADSTP
jgi:YbbR domain-containing protein